MGSGRVRVPEALSGRGGERPLPTFDVPYFKYIDEEDEEDEWSSRSQSSTEDDSGDSLLSDRYVVVSGTPEKILEHLLSDLHLEAAQDKETETLLDDFLLTYTVFMTTDDLCQALLRQYPFIKCGINRGHTPTEKHELQPNDLAISKSFESSSRMFVYRKDLTDSLNPFAENEELQQRSVRILGINTWDLALELTNFDWNLFNAIHEQELIYFTFSRQGSAENTENLSLLLQRCNEVQLWVATEILLCSQLCKRVQLVKKFIKIAAHCKAQRNLNSFFAIVMGLNTASVSRLSQTWEDPSLNHKAYRDAFKKMKSPKIPFMPLLLKDVTFIHEGNKTFLDNLVNFEKLHMIADTVRSLRHCRNNQFGNEVPSKEHHELKPYIHHLHVIDNQQALFELSHRIEPRV
ncbi:rap hypothetical protein [Limosa lapponica baueri]|uniref:Rap guanine nucleotide exchange factor 5 n=1 Tax=Limosa lapponica baueri TaxID=1758121 RepID=A0A2I0TT48_LIMLA|nr:rap hypothetical protein [Limosa lapponica baueri]